LHLYLNFSIIAAPLFQLFRKGMLFVWTSECQAAMDFLKLAMPVLISLNYSPSAGAIFVHVDTSITIDWGVVMSPAVMDVKIPYDLKVVFGRISR
jgi:hypothetical protein